MVDSGTLGTKANVQVVLPYLTESYGSSNDPPDESIPLCTLKSFPYQPEHCVAWAKNVFEQSFSDGILRLKDYLTLITSSTVSEGKGKVLDDYLENLSNDDVVRLHQQMQYLQQLSASNHAEHPEMFLQVLLDWSWDALSRYFNRDIVQLLQEHPADEVDEEQLPFWGG